MHPDVHRVTQDIAARSRLLRDQYRRDIGRYGVPARASQPAQLRESGAWHGIVCWRRQVRYQADGKRNVGIVTAYNDMLSAHAPYAEYPQQIKNALRAMGLYCAGGRWRACDVLMVSRKVNPGWSSVCSAAMSLRRATAVSLSHHMFDAVLMLGICDKIVPGLLMGALQFGTPAHLVCASGDP